MGFATTRHKIENLVNLANQETDNLSQQSHFFRNGSDAAVDKVFDTLQNADIRMLGPEMVFGKMYDPIGFAAINEPMFRYLVIFRIAIQCPAHILSFKIPD